MIQFDRIRKSSLLRDKVYYLCNHIKFYSIKDSTLTAFYFLTQSLALISTLIASPLADATSATQIIDSVNSLFFFYSNHYYARYDENLILSHLISLILFVVFAVIGYFTYTLDHQSRIAISKSDAKKIKIIETLVFILVTFNLPLGSFIWYYVIRLFQMNLEYLVVPSLFNLAFIFAVVYVMEECSIESDLKNYQSLSRLYCKNESIHSIVKMMVRMIIASFNNLASSVIILSLLALLVFDLYELRVSVFSKKYLNSTTESIYYYKNVATVILEVLMLFCLVTDFPLVINNFFLSVVSTSLLAYFSLSQYKQHKKLNLILDGLDSVNSEDDAKIYMLEMISMLDNRKTSEEIFTLSLVTIHREKCKLDSCFCRVLILQDFSKLLNRGQFLRKFVLSKLQAVAEKFASSFLILSILLNYKLSVMSSFSKVYYILKTYTQKNEMILQSFSQQYMLYQIEIIIQKEIHKNHQEKYVEVEKIFNEDSLKLQLAKLIHEVNNRFTEKYKLLGQEICNLNVIDELCLKISNTLRAIEGIWKEFEKKDSYNLKIYEIFLIYFEYICFSRKQAALLKGTIMRKTRALQQLKGISEENMERYLYTDKACVIEIMFNKDKVGIITNISSSCQIVFKHSRDQVLEKDFHELMPEYFSFEHQRWSHEWFDNEVMTGKLLGLVHTYFVDNAGNCFSCSLHMKIASAGFKLKFYVMLIRDNSSDFLLINSNFEIQGIGSRLLNEQILELGSLKKQIGEYTDCNMKEITSEMQEGEVVKKRIVFRSESNLNYSQKNIAFAILSAGEDAPLREPVDSCIHECEVTIERHIVNPRFSYFTIRFYEIRKLVKQNNAYYFKTLNSRNMESIVSNLKCENYHREYKHEMFEAVSGQENQVDSDARLKEESAKQETEDENRFQIHNMSSVAESAMGEGSIIFSKLAEEIKEKSVNYHKVNDRRLTATTFLMLFMIGVVVGSASLQCFLFQTGMESYNQIIFASSAVSNNNQLLEIVYNRATTLYTYCSDSATAQRCAFLLTDTRGLTSKVYSMLVDDLRVYLLNTTSLTGLDYYSYYDTTVTLNLHDKLVQVTAKEFLEYFYYSVKKIQTSTQVNSSSTAPLVIDESLYFLFTNWKTLKLINHQSLAFYESASQKEFRFLMMMTYLFYAIFLVTLCILLLLVYLYYTYIEVKKENIIRLNGFLTHALCGKLRQIGEGVRTCLGKSYEELEVALDAQGLREGKQKSQFRYEQNRKYNYFLVAFFVVMGALHSIILYKTTTLLIPAYNVMIELTDLIQSENLALESYLDLKSAYLFNSSADHTQTLAEVLPMVNVTEIPFATSVRNIVNTMSTLGGNIQDDFNNMLINDVCKVTASQLTLDQVLKCEAGMHYDVINGLGTVAGISFIVRNVMATLMQLRSDNATRRVFFTPASEDIGDYAFYLFKIYQLLEAQVIEGMASLANIISSSISVIVYFEIAVLALTLLLWLTRISAQKMRLSNLYAQVLQLPQSLFRENKLILKILSENLTLKL